MTAIVVAMSLSSCAASLPTRFEMFASNVEKHADNYSPKTWERKNEKFKSLCNEYKENYKQYSTNERRSIHNSMATYVKAAGRSGINTIIDVVSDLTTQISTFVEDAKAFFEGLGLGRKGK